MGWGVYFSMEEKTASAYNFLGGNEVSWKVHEMNVFLCTHFRNQVRDNICLFVKGSLQKSASMCELCDCSYLFFTLELC